MKGKSVAFTQLSQHPLFAKTQSETITYLQKHSSFKTLKKSQVIHFDQQSEEYLYVLMRGRIKILEVDSYGNELIREIVPQGDYFSSNTQEQNEGYSVYARPLTYELILGMIPWKVFEDAMSRDSGLSRKYTKLMTNKLKKLHSRYSRLAFKDVKSRVVSFFQDWAKNEGNRFGNTVYLRNYLTHLDIANLVGTSRQSVTTIMNELKASGNIDYSRYQIVIPDIDKLRG